MNFLVRTFGGKCIVRPDISINRDDGIYYVPDDIDNIGFTPVAVAHLHKSGKVVSKRFAPRYIDNVFFGLLLYPAIENGHKTEFCPGASSCFTGTTFIFHQPLSVEQQSANSLSISKNLKEIFLFRHPEELMDKLTDAIADCSLHSLIRTGDFVMTELSGISDLCSREQGNCRISASYGNDIEDYIEIKF